MADNQQQYQSPSPSIPWGRSPHIYPHSNHGTPAQEYSNFQFGSPQLSMSPGTFENTMPQRPVQQQLQPLIMPQWPSMLNSQSHPTYQTTYPQPVQPIQPMPLAPLPTPLSATSSRSASAPRKTLTDADRKQMCRYAEDNPAAKQTEIGARFGVERSTVSKVLRQKEKYLFQDDGSRSPAKRPKGRSPDIERALAVWAKNQEKKGVALSDESIRQKAQAFSTTSSNPDAQAGLSASWLEKFKMKNNLMGAKSRKGSLAEDADDTSCPPSTSHTPNGASPNSQHALSSPSADEHHDVHSNGATKLEIPNCYPEFIRGNPFHSDSHTSLHSAFTDTTTPFSPTPLSPTTSPFFTPESGTSASPFVAQSGRQSLLPDVSGHANANANSHRQRSQTFPMLDHYMTDATSSADPPTPQYISSSTFDSPMQELPDPLPNLNAAIQDLSASSRPHTITPSDMMRPPPLPSNMAVPRTFTPASAPPTAPATSPEEARKAMEVVVNFFEQQPNGYLDLQESFTVGKLMEKLRLQTRNA